jgi:hypothetical protein
MAKSKKSVELITGNWWVRLLVAGMTVSIGVAAIAVLRDLIETRYAWPPTAPRVVLVNQPPWMSAALAQQIIDTARPVGVHSVFDRELLISTARALQASPWIKQVIQVRRTYVHWPGDTLEVQCVYRVPTALVQWQDYYWLVDGDGYKLPEQYLPDQLPRAMVAPNGKLTLRVIQGVSRPPVLTGSRWPGEDLAAGLELVKLVANTPFADDLRTVDVSNFNGRHDSQAAQIVLITRFGTRIFWGRAPSATDSFVEVPTSQKLQSLNDIYQQMHRVDGGQPWIDIRFDQVLYPSPQPAAAASQSPAASAAGVE